MEKYLGLYPNLEGRSGKIFIFYFSTFFFTRQNNVHVLNAANINWLSS